MTSTWPSSAPKRPPTAPPSPGRAGVIGFTRLEDGDLMLRIEAGVAVAGARSLADAIAEADRLLAFY